jgi:16S rRNA (guanine527-N7)-methyltransferase
MSSRIVAPPPVGEEWDPALWDRLRDRAGAWVTLDAEALVRLQTHAALLGEWNRRFNLTAIEAPEAVIDKHFLDSLSCAAAVDLTAVRSLCDVGSGAGFPGLVLKAVFPHLEVTLLDALEKRLRFLSRVAEAAGLEGVRTLHARAEDAGAAPSRRQGGPIPPGGPFRQSFDLVTARAVAALPVLAEWTLPLARVGGRVLAMKGPEMGDELEAARAHIRTLGGGEPELRSLTLPGTDVRRSLIVIRKERPTPAEYPRPAGWAKRSDPRSRP